MKYILVLITALFLNGCASHYVNVKPIAEQPIKPDIEKSFYLAWPNDGREKSFFTLDWQTNEGSGREVAEIIYNYLRDKGWTVIIGNMPETQKQALESAEKHKTAYMLYPQLNIWNDPSPGSCRYTTVYDYRETEVQDRRNADEADITIFVYNMKDKKILNSYLINAYGCPHVVNNFLPIGTYTPEGQFKRALEEWYKTQTNEKVMEDL